VKTASDILHEVVNSTMGEKHEEALQLLKDWGCKMIDELNEYGKYDQFFEVDQPTMDDLKKRIQENKG